jgi:hypothetical protein
MDSSSCPPIDARATPTPTASSTSTSNVGLDVDAVVHQNKEKDVVPVSSVNVVSNNTNNNDNDNDNKRKAANGSALYSSTDDEESTASDTLSGNGEEASSTMEEGDGSDEGGENHAVQDCSSPTTCIDCCNTDNNTVGSSRSNRSTTSSKTVRLSRSNISSIKSLAIQNANIIKVDKLQIEELKHMTAERRNLVQEEIHGVSSCAIPEETVSNSSNSKSNSKSNSEHTADTTTTTTTTTTDDEDCCNYSSDTITNQENGLKQLDIEIRTIHKEVLFNNLTTHESKDGNTYDEQIWSYLCLDTVDTTNTTDADADADGAAATASASTTTQDQDQQQQSSSSATTPSNSKTDNNNNNNNNSPDEIESRKKRILYSYIYHNDFRLKFLRADMYHARKSAHRYLRCLECLLKYFGPYALQRPLMYNDLCKESQDAIKIGYLQILPSRDRAGRLIVVVQEAMNVTTGHNMSIILKVFLYTFLVVSEDIETQKKGVIFIFSTDEKAVNMVQDIKDRKEYALYREGSPVRRSCTHFCLPENNTKMKHIRAIMMLAMSEEERVRIRIHMDGKYYILNNRID